MIRLTFTLCVLCVLCGQTSAQVGRPGGKRYPGFEEVPQAMPEPSEEKREAIADGHFANAAERILNDPHFLFDQAAAEQAGWADMNAKRKADRKQPVQIERRQDVPGGGGPQSSVATDRQSQRAAWAALHPKHSHNRPQQVSPIATYQAAMYQQGWQRANTPMVWGARR
jgi:hypothetical protein